MKGPTEPEIGKFVVLAILSLFLLSLLLGTTVVGSIGRGSGAGMASPLKASLSSNDSIGAAQLTLAEQTLQAGKGPRMGASIQCTSTVVFTSAECDSTNQLNSDSSKLSFPSTASSTHPSARLAAGLTYDAKDGYVILFGGMNATAYLGDTWKFVGGIWTKLSPTTHPSARAGVGLAYDDKDGYVVLFGGAAACNSTSCSSTPRDTWKFEGGVWTKLTPTTSPPGLVLPSLTYDVKDGYVVLFGGLNGSKWLSGTWTFVGGVWTKLSTAIHPSARNQPSMAYDAKDGYVVLFGGVTNSYAYLNDTWKFQGGSWKKLSPANHPSARFQASSAYDTKDGYLVLFGGYYGTSLNDTWKFVGGAWTELSPAREPPARIQASMTYDAKNGYVVLFGGQDNSGNDFGDTWTFVGDVWNES